jgi:glyoxylase-like metal-dependent hydrolase (beta-lactamase superfamily II)/rhodanese-related sulfurtransferase
MYVQQFFVEGLGCASYLIGCESQGVAAVVDPQRDVRPYLEAAQSRGLQITHSIETHLHADHVSGNTELAARTGAKIVLHEAAQAQFPHQAVKDGDVLQLGGVKIEVRHTPGHTPESITLLVSDTTRSQEPWMALTGDLLFVGDVGRPDLVGSEAARGLAGDLHESLFGKVLRMNDALMIYPGHGAGSLCGRSIGSVRSTTLGYERHANPALAPRPRDEFIEYMTSNLPEQPGNHQRIKAMNRRGPQPLGDGMPRGLSIQEAIPHFHRGAGLLDLRSKEAYIEKHVPGSVHLAADDQLSNRVGFVLSPEQPVVLVLESDADYERVVYSLARVGYERVVGFFVGGMEAWEAAGLPVTSGDIQDVSPQELSAMLKNGSRPVVVDVREPWEYAQGHIPGSLLIPLGQLASRLDELDPSRPVAAICASGNRSQSAAALLGQKGFKKVYNVVHGMTGWQMAGLETARS